MNSAIYLMLSFALVATETVKRSGICASLMTKFSQFHPFAKVSSLSLIEESLEASNFSARLHDLGFEADKAHAAEFVRSKDRVRVKILNPLEVNAKVTENAGFFFNMRSGRLSFDHDKNPTETVVTIYNFPFLHLKQISKSQGVAQDQMNTALHEALDLTLKTLNHEHVHIRQMTETEYGKYFFNKEKERTLWFHRMMKREVSVDRERLETKKIEQDPKYRAAEAICELEAHALNNPDAAPFWSRVKAEVAKGDGTDWSKVFKEFEVLSRARSREALPEDKPYLAAANPEERALIQAELKSFLKIGKFLKTPA